MEALKKMPQHTVHATMECAGNDRLGMIPLPAGEPWEHGAVSTLSWTGVPLAAVLKMAGVKEDAVEVLFTAADAGPREDAEGEVRFARALPIKVALHEDVLLALAMNGEPLTPDHGFPVRLAVPGWYGMASVKWVTKIEVITTPFDGYFHRERYVYDDSSGITPVTHTLVKSMITEPANRAQTARKIKISGWAWSGNGAITKVELAIEGGEEWYPATVGTPDSLYAWTPWSIEITLPHSGRFVLRSRATDASRATQPEQIVWNRLGYGNNAIRHVVITAE
jgi:DMSO/TMAO reductase YedYZ molybdopterin-dependent catalytic subunit